MRRLRFTLSADGPSDDALLRIIDWTLSEIAALSGVARIPQFADPRQAPSRKLPDRFRDAVSRFPCDILFVHRDAERDPLDERIAEIREELAETEPPYVPVVPVRMTEAWLLIDAAAIRKAADNPNGKEPLQLPALKRLEEIPDPKQTLNELLLDVSGKKGRRRASLQGQLPWRRCRVAELIDDFSPLRSLPAFQAFEAETRRVINVWLEGQAGNA